MLSAQHFCNKINTLVFSGGGNYGILYLGVIKFLEKANILKDINSYYGVSSGAMTAAALNIGYTQTELLDIMTNEFNYKDIIRFELKNVLNITSTFGCNDGKKMETFLKTALERKNINPYITLKGLYDLTGKDLYIGTTGLISKKFILLHHSTHPDLQVWLAVRMSTCIPLIFTPIKDTENNDIYVDGCLLNNSPINFVIWKLLKDEISTNEKTKKETTDEETKLQQHKQEEQEKEENKCYKHNFICVNLINDNTKQPDINNLTFFNYIQTLIGTTLINQSYNKDKYKDYVINIICNNYTDYGDITTNINYDDVLKVINEISYTFEKDFNNKIKLSYSKKEKEPKTNEITNLDNIII